MKKILITTGVFSPDIGGPASYSGAIAVRLAKNFSVTVVAYSSRAMFPGDRNLPYKVIRIWKKIPKPFRHLYFFLRVLGAAKGADLIYSLNAVSAGVPSVFASRILRKRLFVKIVGDYAWEIALNKQKSSLLINDFQQISKKGWIGYLHRMQVWVCRKAKGVVVPSEYLSKVVRGWGVSADKIKVIYNGVDFKASDVSKEEARKKIGISGNIITSSGRLVPWKGFRMLVKIMPQLLDINQFFRLIIIGEGPERRMLALMIKNLGLERKVYLVGRKTKGEMALYMAASDIFVLATGYEGFSHQILEAMACGVPVITTAVGGNREVIHQGENGFMVKYNDEFNLVEAIKTVWQIPEMRQKFIEKGKETAAYFTVEKMLEETINFLIS